MESTQNFSPQDRVQSVVAGDTGTVSSVTEGRPHVEWDDGTNCSIAPRDITRIDEVVSARTAMDTRPAHQVPKWVAWYSNPRGLSCRVEYSDEPEDREIQAQMLRFADTIFGAAESVRVSRSDMSGREA
jgi:hypothetical protein